MAKRVNISTARKDLPILFDRVTDREGEKVVIRRRDGGQEAVLVSRSYVEQLELASRRSSGRVFRLLGSGTLLAPGDEVLRVVRAAEVAETEKREQELAPPRKSRR